MAASPSLRVQALELARLRLMVVRLATPADLGAIADMLARAPHRHVQLGAEDVPAAIAADRCLLLLDDAHSSAQLAALLVTFDEARPSSLPVSAPDRVYVRGVAFRHHLSPTVALQELLRAFRTQAPQTPTPRQLIAYSGEGWLDRALAGAGMTYAEAVKYFVLDRLQQRNWQAPQPATPCAIRDATPADLIALADLDAQAFPSHWHYGQRQLQEALLHGPLLVATVADELVGYVALHLTRDDCTIVRLAVRPLCQGQGYGRTLLLAGLHVAQQWGCARALLNTQAGNLRSQQLYRAVGFRPTGEIFRVFILDLPSRELLPPATM